MNDTFLEEALKIFKEYTQYAQKMEESKGIFPRSTYSDIARKMFVVDPLPTGALPVFKKENNPSELNQEPKQLKQSWSIVEDKTCFSRPAKIEDDLAYTLGEPKYTFSEKDFGKKEKEETFYSIIKNRDTPPQKLSLMEEEDRRVLKFLEEVARLDTSTKISSKRCNVCNQNVTTCSQDIEYVCYGCRSMFDRPAE